MPLRDEQFAMVKDERGADLNRAMLDAGCWMLVFWARRFRRSFHRSIASGSLSSIQTPASRILSPSHALVDPPELFHFGGVKQIAPIKHDRMRQAFFGTSQIEFFELIPFRRHD